MTDRLEDYAAAGFRGRIGPGSAPALVVVDLVRAYLDPESPLSDDGGRFEAARASVQRLVAVAREHAVPVVWTTVSLAPGGADAGWFAVKVPGLAVFEHGSPLAEFPESPRPVGQELVVTKQYASSFFGTTLASSLRARGVDTTYVVGFSTSGCVRATALDALQHGFRPLIVADACGDREQAAHDQNLFDLDAKYADVVTESDAIAHLTTLGATR